MCISLNRRKNKDNLYSIVRRCLTGKKWIALCLLLSLKTGYSQEKPEEVNTLEIKKAYWSYRIGLGLNTTSRDSKHVGFIAPNYSLGAIRNLRSKRILQHAIEFKLSLFQERFSGIPFYQLNESNTLVSSTMKQTNSFPMFYTGWLTKYWLKENKMFVQGGLGFNYMFLSTYKRKFSDGSSGKLNVIIPPGNWFVTRPEVSIGVGFKKEFNKFDLTFKPTYRYNFTTGNLNLIPSFHAISLITVFSLKQ